MQLGIDRLLNTKGLRSGLGKKRLAFLGHPASLTSDGRHSLDCLMECSDLKLTAAFGPQHGIFGEKQDNMVESDDSADPRHGIPVFSLYGEVRRPTTDMMNAFDVLLVDLQDLGTRIYTYVTTLCYMLEACAEHKKEIWVLDRPNPVGRPCEGTILEDGWESFVGVGPLLMRHGLTLGELAKWYVGIKQLKVSLKVVEMEIYDPNAAPGYGWPLGELSWVNPSPNASSLNMARCFPGTVLFEGTTLSEGRGTTTPLEVVGAPDIDVMKIVERMISMSPKWLEGCLIRPCHFEPTFHKYVGELCCGLHIHTDNATYKHGVFRPYRLAALFLKALRLEHPSYNLWRDFPYEYETERLAIDLLTGGTFLREWVDDPSREVGALEERLGRDEQHWLESRKEHLLY